VSGTFELAGGTIAPGNSGIGTLTFVNSNFVVTQASTFAVDLGGTTADQLKFTNPLSNVNIGSGLLTLSLNLLSAPTTNTTFNLITINAGSNTIVGSFAGLPSSGNTLTANFGGNPYTFVVNYQPSFVSLTFNAVPEPSTYGLMGAGLLLVGYAYRKRRRSAHFNKL
jgi:hypothetical protein